MECQLAPLRLFSFHHSFIMKRHVNSKGEMPLTVVYVDTMLLVNGMINYLLLLATGHLAGVRLHRLRLLLGSLLGALYSIAVYLPGAGFLQAVPIKLGVAVLMLLIGYGGVKRFLRLTLLFFAVSFVFGGGVLALQLLSGRSLVEHGGFLVAAGMRELILATALCYLILSVVFRRSARHGGSRRDIVSVRATYGGRKTNFNALMDSGNTLTDPLTNAPVIIAEWEVLAPLLTSEQKAVLTPNLIQNAPMALEQLGTFGKGRFRLIPYQAVGVSGGLLLTLRPDAVYLGEVLYSGIFFAFSPTPLSDGGPYAALVGDLEDCRDCVAALWQRGKTKGGKI